MTPDSQSLDFAEIDLAQIYLLAASDLPTILATLRAQHAEALEIAPDSDRTRDLVRKLYWLASSFCDASANQRNPNAQVQHPGLELDMAREPMARLSTARDFEPLDDYARRLPFIVDASTTEAIGEYWTEKRHVLMSKLGDPAIDHFKRTCGHALSNFWPLRYDQKFDDLIGFLRAVGDTSIHADKTEPTVRGQFSYLHSPDTALKTAGSEAESFRFYAFYTGLVWRKAVFEDTLCVLGALEESLIGNPYRIRKGSWLIAQDLARSAIEYGLLKTQLGKQANGTILEIGAGYGRLAEVFLQRGTERYIIVDIFPMIYLAEQYLKARFPGLKVFGLRDFRDYGDVAQELEDARVVLLAPDQMPLLPENVVDLVININSFMEMSAGEVDAYFTQIDRVSRGYLYSKQWKPNKEKGGVHLFKTGNYPIRPHWTLRYERDDPLHSDFFEEIWAVG